MCKERAEKDASDGERLPVSVWFMLFVSPVVVLILLGLLIYMLLLLLLLMLLLVL